MEAKKYYRGTSRKDQMSLQCTPNYNLLQVSPVIPILLKNYLIENKCRNEIVSKAHHIILIYCEVQFFWGTTSYYKFIKIQMIITARLHL